MNLKKRLRTIIVSNIETTVVRKSYLKTVLIGTTISAAIGLGLLQYESITPVRSVRGNSYTENEYQQLKTAEISLIANRKLSPPTFEEAEIWKEIVSVECKNIVLHNVKSDTLVDQLNGYLSNNCKE